MSQHDRDADRKFAHQLFTGKPADKADREDQGASEYTDEQRRWARELFADDEDDPILAGLTSGKTTARWRAATDD